MTRKKGINMNRKKTKNAHTTNYYFFYVLCMNHQKEEKDKLVNSWCVVAGSFFLPLSKESQTFFFLPFCRWLNARRE